MPVSKTSIATRLVLFTTRFGRPPTSDETVKILDGELHLYDHEEEEAIRLKAEKEKREKKIEEQKEEEAARHLEERPSESEEIQLKKSFNGDRFKHAAYLLKAEHHNAALRKKKEAKGRKHDLNNEVRATKMSQPNHGSRQCDGFKRLKTTHKTR